MEELFDLLKNSKVIAVLGATTDPFSASNGVAKDLICHGYKVYLVNPTRIGEEIDGIGFVAKLSDINEQIDIIDVFRKSEDLTEHVDEIITTNPRTVWLQLGISNPEVESKILEKGINLVKNKCISQILMVM
jgi:predicted CoA-binding protein